MTATQKKLTNREWLNKTIALDLEIKALETARMAALTIADYQSRDFSERVCGSRHNSQEDKSISYVDYALQIRAAQESLFDLKARLLKAINQLDNAASRVLLIEVYINGKALQDISQFNLQPDTLRRKLKHAVEKLEIDTN